MNKKLLYGISAFIIAAVSVFNLNFNSQKSHLSDMALANVEALADAEAASGEKICYFRGTTQYKEFYACEGSYPNVNSCGNTSRASDWFSTDNHVCN
jgi:hypothetical protein